MSTALPVRASAAPAGGLAAVIDAASTVIGDDVGVVGVRGAVVVGAVLAGGFVVVVVDDVEVLSPATHAGTVLYRYASRRSL